MNLTPVFVYPHHMVASPSQLDERRHALAQQAARFDELRRVHAAVARQLAHPDSPRAQDLLAQAGRNIANWEQAHTCSPFYVRAWRRILRNPGPGLHRLVTQKAALADAMLQNTPFGFALRDPAFRR